MTVFNLGLRVEHERWHVAPHHQAQYKGGKTPRELQVERGSTEIEAGEAERGRVEEKAVRRRKRTRWKTEVA